MLSDPRSLIAHNLMFLDNLYSSLVHALQGHLYRLRMDVESLSAKLHKLSPVQQLAYKQQWTMELRRRLKNLLLRQLEKKKYRLHTASTLLDAVSPLNVLGRGYAVVRSGPNEKPPGELIRTVRQVTIGKDLEVILQEGRLGCEVNEIKEDNREEHM